MPQLGDRVVHGGEVAERRECGLLGDPAGDPHRAVPARPAGAVGDRHERRGERLELADREPEFALVLLGFGRHELEGEGLGPGRQQVADGIAACVRRHGVPRHAPRVSGPRLSPHGPAGLSMADRRHQGRSSHRRSRGWPPGTAKASVRRSTSAGARPCGYGGIGYPRDHDRTGGGCARPRSRPGRPGTHRIRRAEAAGTGDRGSRRAASSSHRCHGGGRALAGGKRLRPAFCYWGWRGVGRGPTARPSSRPRPRSNCCTRARSCTTLTCWTTGRHPPWQPDDPPALRRAACRRGLAGSRCAVR